MVESSSLKFSILFRSVREFQFRIFFCIILHYKLSVLISFWLLPRSCFVAVLRYWLVIYQTFHSLPNNHHNIDSFEMYLLRIFLFKLEDCSNKKHCNFLNRFKLLCKKHLHVLSCVLNLNTQNNIYSMFLAFLY